MIKDYLAGWVDAAGMFSLNLKDGNLYPIVRVRAPEPIPGLLKEAFGGHTREGVWEITKKDETIRVLREFEKLLVVKNEIASTFADVIKAKGETIAPTVERLKRLQSGESEDQ